MAKNYTLTWDPAAAQTFSTTFALTESPISESGAWRTNLCPFFKDCQTAGGRVYGNQPQVGIVSPVALFEDSYAHLAGSWPANQRAEGIIDKRTTGGFQEFEIHLLGSDASDRVKCYEIFVHQNGDYFTLAMWKGTALTSAATASYFDIMADAGVITAPADGDTLWGQIVGNQLTAGFIRVGGTVQTLINFDVTSGGRTRIASGTPGIGFDAGGSGAETATTNYGFKSFFASGL